MEQNDYDSNIIVSNIMKSDILIESEEQVKKFDEVKLKRIIKIAFTLNIISFMYFLINFIIWKIDDNIISFEKITKIIKVVVIIEIVIATIVAFIFLYISFKSKNAINKLYSKFNDYLYIKCKILTINNELEFEDIKSLKNKLDERLEVIELW